jgi:hypothetical protein
MSEVVNLADRRRPTRPDDQVAICRCGSQWFELRRRESDPEGIDHGAVTMTTEGSVTGYLGEPCCVECGATWAPKQGWMAY